MNASAQALLAVALSTSTALAQTDCPTASPDQIASTLGFEESAGPVQSVLVRDGSSVGTLYFTVSQGRAIYEGDIVLGDADEIERLAKDGPISLDPGIGDANPLKGRGLVLRRALSSTFRISGGET